MVETIMRFKGSQSVLLLTPRRFRQGTIFSITLNASFTRFPESRALSRGGTLILHPQLWLQESLTVKDSYRKATLSGR